MWHADENFDPDDALHTLGFDLRASFSTCAIVGSSGALLHDRRGAEIDAHDLVIRFNNAPVAGYEAVVGSRTDLRLLNSHAIAGILQRCARFSSNGTCAPVPQRHACCPKAKVLLNSGRERIALCYRSACGGANAPGQANVLTALSDHPLILAFKASLPASQSLLSGVHAIAVAQLVCKRRISLYGFTSEPRWRASADGVAVQPSYHYYDDCAPFASDGLSATATSMNSPWFRQRFASSSRTNEFAARVHMVGPSARHHPRWVRWNATTAASRPASCASRSAIGVINSILRRAEKASRQVPCCKNKSLEAERMGRCAWYADRGECDTYTKLCPIMCDTCAVCEGHRDRQRYVQLFQRMRNPPLSYAQSTSTGTQLLESEMRSERVFQSMDEMSRDDKNTMAGNQMNKKARVKSHVKSGVVHK